MKLRLTTDRNDRGYEQRAGDVLEFAPAEAKRLLDGRQAEIVVPDPVETAAQYPTHPPRKRGKQ